MSVLNVEHWARAEDIPEPRTDFQTASLYCETVPASDNTLVILPGNGVSIKDCARASFQKLAERRRMYYRGGVVVEVKSMGRDRLELSIVDAAAFRSRLETAGPVFAWRSGANGGPVLKPGVCAEETAKALLASEEAMEYLPHIASVVNCPVLVRSDAEPQVLGAGYHFSLGGVLVTAGEAPGHVEWAEAVEALSSLLSDFDFQSDGDRSRALAQLITPALKVGGWVSGFVPVDVAEADQSQSGKTYRQRLTAILYNEQPRIVAKRHGGVGSVDESFAQALVAGSLFIQFDNFRGKLDSQFIEAFLTAVGLFAARIPHRGDVLIDPTKFFLLLTSNGVETSPDMANRSCIVRIRKRVGYTFRRYEEGDLMAHVRARQSYYLGCVFAIIRRWREEGERRTSTSEHDFRDWAQSLDWIVQHIFQSAPLLDGHRAAQKRVSNPTLNFLRLLALRAKTIGQLDVDLSASSLFELALEYEIDVPGFSDQDEGQAKRHIGLLMGRLFKEENPVCVDGFEVSRHERETRRDDGGGRHLVKFYCFREILANSRMGAEGAQMD